MTVNELLNNGYHMGGTAYQRGYISRKGDFDCGSQQVMTAGGNRQGEFYFLRPCYQSTRYCIRQYLVKD